MTEDRCCQPANELELDMFAGEAGESDLSGAPADAGTKGGALLPEDNTVTDVKGRRILVVDDTKTNITVLLEMLRDDYKLGVAMNGPKALEYARSQHPDLILLDVMMPGMDGYEVCRELKRDPSTRDIPVMFISAVKEAKNKTEGLNSGGVDYITKPFDVSEVKARVKTHLTLKVAQERLENQNAVLDQRVKERTRELRNTQIEVVTRLCLAAEFRDTETGNHIKRISHYTALIAKQMQLEEEQQELIYHASSMHDVGKIGIPDDILLKPGRLEQNEWIIMKKHSEIGARMLEGGSSKLLQLAHNIALTHHERWDGKGYPKGLKGEEIPIAGRITSLCDVFDALTTKRPYKGAWPVADAIREVLAGRGTQFDPDVVDAFECVQEGFVRIKERFSD